ncbi:CRP-like cAMP-binding protein [Dysgonomonas hofstadii]|uniref:CRP-like cAMP-binding protein n=1 Tax=Dysgonomonas hofstadii TaxID=637886 RepID=A0A840CTG8_9BACT|nr:Crp/Fnr family transcriptional regulator [Dysgonomonas hofstadii]MBB4036974.1 CRP-like cAMP-binding protein [Dysgonomonas hofstadii]
MVNQYELTDRQKEIILRIPLFRGISEELKNNFFDRIDYSFTPLKKGNIIIEQGTTCNHLHILLSGTLDVNIIDASGNDIKVEDLIGPRSFATPHLFDGNNIFPATFTVVEDGLLMRITKESAFKLISSEPEMLRNFLRLTGNCNVCTVSRLRILAYKNIRSRFSYYLLEYKRDENDMITIAHNQTQLAEFINVTRPALAREIRSMIDEGIIEMSGKNIRIANYKALLQNI